MKSLNPYWVLLWLSLSVGAAMIGLGIIWPLVPLIAVDLGASGIQVGVIIAGFNVSRSLSNPFVGRLSDHIGKKNFVLAGLLIYALLSFLYVEAVSIESLIGVRLLHGFASVLVVPVAMAWVAEIAPESEMGIFMGTMSMTTMLGIGIGPIVGGVVKDFFGMNAPFYTMGGLVLVVFLGVLIFIPSSVSNPIEKPNPNRRSFKNLIGNRTFQSLFLLRFFAAAGQGAVYTFLPLLAVHLNITSSQVGIVLGANIFLIALLQRLFGKLADRHNPAFFIIAGTFASGLSVLGIPLAGTFFTILLLNIVMGIANGTAMPGGYVIAGRLGQRHGMGSVMGLADSSWSLGMVISPILSGCILDIFGVKSVFYLAGGLILSGTVGAALLFRTETATEMRPSVSQ